ncbi:hypothetical protein D3Z36_17270 [Lachnospiraceae bacterium]|nr:hypothetical protein [Lachnospiraceae bacterium]
MVHAFGAEFPDGIQDVKLPWVRRPLVLVRGKPVSVEQAVQIITGEEPLFEEVYEWEGMGSDPREDRGVLKNIFYRQGYGWLSTWLYSDGTIGGNLIHLGKYPEIEEVVELYSPLAQKYPFLDMVVAYTGYNESCCYSCDFDIYKCRECKPYRDRIRKYCLDESLVRNRKPGFEELYFRDWFNWHIRNDVDDAVRLTIWIHDSKAEVLFGEKAADKFVEYNKQYYAEEYSFMFSSELYSYGMTCVCSKEFVEDCFEYIGKPRSLCDEYVKRGFIAPFPEDAAVVTKDWVVSQYHQYICRKKKKK